jgi:hypothetical protein
MRGQSPAECREGRAKARPSIPRPPERETTAHFRRSRREVFSLGNGNREPDGAGTCPHTRVGVSFT